MIRNKKKGFTLAEVLITLVVVGIIASITIMIINSNVRKAEVETKLKRNVSILNSALYRATTDYGPAYAWNETGTEAFNNKYLIPNLITLKPPTEQTLQELGYKGTIKDPNGNDYFYKNFRGKKIFLNDGTIILHTVNVVPSGEIKQNIAIKYVIDINGPKGPNVMGRDVFVFEVDLLDTAPYVKMEGMAGVNIIEDENGGYRLERVEYPKSQIITICKNQGNNCGALIQKNSWKVPSDYPIKI